jgi:arylsulfatase A-like enzyme
LVGRVAFAAAALALIAAVLAAGADPAQTKKRTPKQTRPNIVLIMDDDQSAELQRFLTKTNAAIGGKKGVTFANSFVSYSLCCPSRATMLTGQYAHNNGVRGNQPPSGGYSKLQPTLDNSLPVWLQRSGYATAHIGKFLNGYGSAPSLDSEVPPGWSEWYGSVDDPDAYTGGSTYSAYGYTLNENGTPVHYGATNQAVVDPGTYQTDVYSQKAADFIRRRAPSRTPFYLSVAPRDPHSESASCDCAGNNPRAAPRYEGALAGESPPITPNFNEADVSDKPATIKDLPPLTPFQINGVYQRYRARAEALLGVDDLVQNVVSTLKGEGELDNTVLIFTSDNGFFHGEHRVPQGKIRLYEPSIRIPLLIRAPGLPHGVTRKQPVFNVDLAPTILDFAGAKAGRVEDGTSLIPLIKDKLQRTGRAIGLETFFNADDPTEEPDSPPQNYGGVRTDRYLYAVYGTGEKELYDLRTDPYELQNRQGDPGLAPVQASLDRLLGAIGHCAGSSCRAHEKVKLRLRATAGCGNLIAGFKGKQRKEVVEAVFFAGSKKVGSDSSAPIEGSIPGRKVAGHGPTLQAIVTTLDGRELTVTRKLPSGC